MTGVRAGLMCAVLAVRVQMANLRKKIEADASQPRRLRTEAGVGYRFVPG